MKVANCCWGEWGQPEPKAIYHQLTEKRFRESIDREDYVLSCEQVPECKLAIIANPGNVEKIDELLKCRPGGIVRNQGVFKSIEWQ